MGRDDNRYQHHYHQQQRHSHSRGSGSGSSSGGSRHQHHRSHHHQRASTRSEPYESSPFQVSPFVPLQQPPSIPPQQMIHHLSPYMMQQPPIQTQQHQLQHLQFNQQLDNSLQYQPDSLRDPNLCISGQSEILLPPSYAMQNIQNFQSWINPSNISPIPTQVISQVEASALPSVALERLQLPPSHITETGIIPNSPYYELPAALMTPLVAPSQHLYTPLNPQELRLPLPKFPDENFLKMIDSYYSADGPVRDNDGWDRQFIDTFLGQKKALAE